MAEGQARPTRRAEQKTSAKLRQKIRPNIEFIDSRFAFSCNPEAFCWSSKSSEPVSSPVPVPHIEAKDHQSF